MTIPKLDEIAAWQWPAWARLSRRFWLGGEFDPIAQRMDWIRQKHGIPGAL